MSIIPVNTLSSPWTKRSLAVAGSVVAITITGLVSGIVNTVNKDLDASHSSALIVPFSLLLLLETAVLSVKSRRSVYSHVNEEASKEILNHYIDIATNPLKFLEEEDSRLILKEIGVSECACPVFDRSKNSRRHSMETEIVSFFNTSHSKDQQISLLSLGSQKMGQDWILIVKLIEQGFRNFSLTFVDPELCLESVNNCIQSLRKLEGVKISYSTYQSIQHLTFKARNLFFTFDAIYAIDYDGILNAYSTSFVRGLVVGDLSEVFKYLKPQGRLFLSSLSDMVFSSKQLLKLTPAKKLIGECATIISKNVPIDTTSISIGCEDSNWELLLSILKPLINQGIDITVFYEIDEIFNRTPHEVLMIHHAFPKVKVATYESQRRPSHLDIVLTEKDPNDSVLDLEEDSDSDTKALDWTNDTIIFHFERYNFTVSKQSKKS